MQAPRSMDEARVWMTMGSGLPSPAPEYSTAVSRCDVVLRKPHSMYPRHPCSSGVSNESGSSASPPRPRNSSRPGGSRITREIFMTADWSTKMVVANRFPPCWNCSKSLAGNRRRIVLYTWNIGPEYSTCEHRVSHIRCGVCMNMYRKPALVDWSTKFV
jgi:hypothetical protein